MNIDVRISRARTALIMQHPFFGALAMRLVARERGDIETMATDGTHLFYRPAFLDTVTDVDVIRIVAHEVLHCSLGHHTRRGNRDPLLWNIACDHVVNLMLRKAGWTIPPDRYCDPQYGNLNAEEIYLILKKEQEDQKQQDAGGSTTGRMTNPTPNFEDVDKEKNDGPSENDVADDPASGEPSPDDAPDREQLPVSPNGSPKEDDQKSSGDPTGGAESSAGEAEGGEEAPGPEENYPEAHGDPGGDGEVLDAAPAHEEAALSEAEDEWRTYTRQAANIAKRGEGREAGFAEEVIEVLNKPSMDWREVLRRFVEPSDNKDYSWTNPNRRMLGLGYYTPGLISDGVHHIAMLIDTSGSIDTEWLRKFGCEVQAALDEGIIDRITLVFADTQVQRTAEYTRGDVIDFTVYGRGGTMFSPTFAWVDQHAPDIAAAIYFTDLECSDFGPPPGYPVLWAVFGSDPRRVKECVAKAPWGEAVELQ